MENANLTKTTLKWLYDSAIWARFLSILGFIFIGLIALIGIVITPIMSFLNEEMSTSAIGSDFPTFAFALIYLLLALVHFFPVYYLFKFSNGVIIAYKKKQEDELNASLYFLKKHFKYMGILTIVIIAIYIILFIIGIAASILNLF